jgi:glycosyltransferase involved in cell wall biosynthesis
MHLGRRDKVPFPDSYRGFRLVRTHGRVFALPPAVDTERVLNTPGLMFRHPAVLSAPTLEGVQAAVDRFDPRTLAPEAVDVDGGYEIVRHRGALYAVPRGAGGVDLDVADDRRRAGVIPGGSVEELGDAVPRAAAATPVEFAGWLPVYVVSGNCGQHPQFAHTGEPPPGYRFTHSAPAPRPASWADRLRTRFCRFAVAVGKRLRTAFYVARVPVTFVLPARGVTLAARWHVLAAFVRLFAVLLRRGCGLGAALRFLQTRHLQSQLLLGKRDLVFLTSMPYTYGQNPWVIEIEDPTTLFYPLVQNGHTGPLSLRDSPYFPAVKALLEDPACKAVVTHMRSTAELVPALFGSEAVRRKVVYAPLGVPLPARWQRHDPEPPAAPVHLLFINSWCQVPENFFLRGGLEVLEAFDQLRRKYPQVRLTMRTALPLLDDHYHRIVESGWVRVVNRFMSAEEMADLHAGSHVFLLPAARVHIVSLLQAMSYGLPVVGSDGWGMEEYLEDGRNGLVVRGRYGKASWADADAGMLRENYEETFTPDPAVVAGLVEAVSRLVEDRELRRRLGRQARRDVETRYTVGRWNEALAAAFDKARG